MEEVNGDRKIFFFFFGGVNRDSQWDAPHTRTSRRCRCHYTTCYHYAPTARMRTATTTTRTPPLPHPTRTPTPPPHHTLHTPHPPPPTLPATHTTFTRTCAPLIRTKTPRTALSLRSTPPARLRTYHTHRYLPTCRAARTARTASPHLRCGRLVDGFIRFYRFFWFTIYVSN